MKADKHQELSELMHNSITKVDAIKLKQSEEAKSYKEAEILIIDAKRQTQLEQNQRITDACNQFEQEKSEIDAALAQVEEKVYDDTQEQHAEKHKLDEMIDDLSREIEELMRVLERKKKEKDMLQLEK